jgi:hypothetical protein
MKLLLFVTIIAAAFSLQAQGLKPLGPIVRKIQSQPIQTGSMPKSPTPTSGSMPTGLAPTSGSMTTNDEWLNQGCRLGLYDPLLCELRKGDR